MKVKIIASTPNPIDIMWTAARTCYSEKSPIELSEFNNLYPDAIETDMTLEYKELMTAKRWKLVKAVLGSGHSSIAEQISFTFAIEGVSRALLAQLTRHRAGVVFSVQSQRYVEIKEDYHYLEDLNFNLYPPEPDYEKSYEETEKETQELSNKLKEILNKYFVGVNDNNMKQYLDDLIKYLYDVHPMFGNMKPEDARMGLPNAAKTNITMTINFRELMHICNLRLCKRAQKEIRDLFKLIKEEVTKVDKRLGDLLVPTCEINGVCYEHKCCGRKPHIDEVMSVYNNHKNDVDTLSRVDMKMLLDSIENPQVNEKLKELLNQKGLL